MYAEYLIWGIAWVTSILAIVNELKDFPNADKLKKKRYKASLVFLAVFFLVTGVKFLTV